MPPPPADKTPPGEVETASDKDGVAYSVGPESTQSREDGAAAGSGSSSSSSGYGSSDEHPFSDPEVAARWRDVYEKARYENRHRFDPNYRWTADEEKKLVRKIDRRIMVWAWVMFCGLDLHRRNINRAISDNMLPEIGKLPAPTYLGT